ncbi:MAG: T9SS type A sorting domain-containing protein, partial [Ignavibacteria bacterium]|nr:T9SS type A sorting domain-containing protein [Ignavibacteria bacterium]
EDTILLVRSGGFDGGLYRTTNGGNSWHYLYDFGSSANPNKIYMYNKDIGFVCNIITPDLYLYKTTNGGINWTHLSGGSFGELYFIDELTGWKAQSNIKMTIDGGLNWIAQQLPQNPNIIVNRIDDIAVLNKDTLFGVRGSLYIPELNSYYGIIYKTTNSGLNWGYQLTDTSIHISHYKNINFINDKHGWAYKLIDGIHTTTGGSDTTIYTGIVNNYQTINDFILEQNYPNPFNSITNVKFKMLNSRFAEIKVYDITGKLIRVLTSKKYEPGEHTVRFDAAGLPSGVYFYKLTAGEYNAVKKMILIR